MDTKTFGNTEAAITLAKLLFESDVPRKERALVASNLSEYSTCLRAILKLEISLQLKVHLLQMVRDKYWNHINSLIQIHPTVRNYTLCVVDTRFRIEYRKLRGIKSIHDSPI